MEKKQNPPGVLLNSNRRPMLLKRRNIKKSLFLLLILLFGFSSQFTFIKSFSNTNNIQYFGENEWVVSYKTTKTTQITDLWVNDQNIIAFGYQDGDVSVEDANLILFNWAINGTLLWSKLIEFKDQQAIAGDLWSDGTYIYTLAAVEVGGYNLARWIAKWDYDGNNIWNKTASRDGDQRPLGLFYYENHLLSLTSNSGPDTLMFETWATNGTLISSVNLSLGDYNHCRNIWFNDTEFFATGSFEFVPTLYRFSPQGTLLNRTSLEVSSTFICITGNENHLLLSSRGNNSFNTYLLNYSGESVSNATINFQSTESWDNYFVDKMIFDGLNFYLAGNGPYEDSRRIPMIFCLNSTNAVIANTTINDNLGTGGTTLIESDKNLYITWWSADQSIKLMKISSSLTNNVYEIKETISILGFDLEIFSYLTLVFVIIVISRTVIHVNHPKKAKKPDIS